MVSELDLDAVVRVKKVKLGFDGASTPPSATKPPPRSSANTPSPPRPNPASTKPREFQGPLQRTVPLSSGHSASNPGATCAPCSVALPRGRSAGPVVDGRARLRSRARPRGRLSVERSARGRENRGSASTPTGSLQRLWSREGPAPHLAPSAARPPPPRLLPRDFSEVLRLQDGVGACLPARRASLHCTDEPPRARGFLSARPAANELRSYPPGGRD
jgi:hypothetical protein